MNGAWRPFGTTGSHQNNYWARNGGDAGPGTYRWDLNLNGLLEADNGAANPGDRDETGMFSAWTLYNLGNLVVNQRPSSNPWTSVSPAHPRFYASVALLGMLLVLAPDGARSGPRQRCPT